MKRLRIKKITKYKNSVIAFALVADFFNPKSRFKNEAAFGICESRGPELHRRLKVMSLARYFSSTPQNNYTRVLFACK